MREPITVHFDEADPGGILFFGRVLTLAHRVFETVVVPRLVPEWDDWFRSDAFVVPIRHAEATFSHPMRPGRRHAADVEIVSVGTTSFEVRTRFVEEGEEGDRLCAETRVAHVFADPATFVKRPIPEAIRNRLLALQGPPAGTPAAGGGTSPAPSAESR
jgi:acyl-CoA thioesterase FadM